MSHDHHPSPPPSPRTAARSHQLVAASQRTTLDPFEYVDWSVPIDDSAFHLPPELLPLYGTAAWDAMTETEQIAYSRHETAALCGAGIWFENVLMQVVLRHLAELPVTDPAHRYLLVEVADECRHSTMFGEYIRRAGTPAYRPALARDSLVRRRRPAPRAVSYLLILAVEELLDYMNRATMRDERVHPTSRAMAKLHVLEEARHVSFAKTYLAEIVADARRRRTRREVADAAPVLVVGRRRPERRPRGLRAPRHRGRRRDRAGEPAPPRDDRRRPRRSSRPSSPRSASSTTSTARPGRSSASSPSGPRLTASLEAASSASGKRAAREAPSRGDRPHAHSSASCIRKMEIR